MAGRNLIRYLVEKRNAKFKDIDAGMVYMISNKSFPEHVKIGMTLDVIERLEQYQTYDPYRQFKIEKYNFVLNRRFKEKQILNHPDLFKEQVNGLRKRIQKRYF